MFLHIQLCSADFSHFPSSLGKLLAFAACNVLANASPVSGTANSCSWEVMRTWHRHASPPSCSGRISGKGKREHPHACLQVTPAGTSRTGLNVPCQWATKLALYDGKGRTRRDLMLRKKNASWGRHPVSNLMHVQGKART